VRSKLRRIVCSTTLRRQPLETACTLAGLGWRDKWALGRRFGLTTGLDPGLTSPRPHVIPGGEAPWARRQPTSSAIHLAGGRYDFSANLR
jgi:hypothetical protein